MIKFKKVDKILYPECLTLLMVAIMMLIVSGIYYLLTGELLKYFMVTSMAYIVVIPEIELLRRIELS